MVYLNVDKLLKERGKTRYWLVKQLQSDYATINKLVNRQSAAVYLDTIEKLLEVFDCDFNDLFIKE